MKIEFKIVWSKRAEKSFEQIVYYIENNWSKKSSDKFIQRTFKILELISQNPRMYVQINDEKIRKGIITKQTSFFYKIKNQEIMIITFWDNRKNPQKLKF